MCSVRNTLFETLDSKTLGRPSKQAKMVLELATITDHHTSGSLARVGADSFNGLDDIQTLDYVPKYYMFPIEPWSSSSTKEELRAIGIRPRIGHRQYTWAMVLLYEILIRELIAIYRLSASSVASSEVSTLAHELGDDSVELGTFEV